MIRYALFLGLGGPVTLACSVLVLAGGVAGAGRGFFDRVQRAWARILLALAGVRLEVEGRENLVRDGPQVVVSNHQSLFDIPALFAALPVSLRFVAKIELSRVPVFAHAMRRAGHVFIDRTDRNQAMSAMRAAGERMKREGLSLGLFPEGTRSGDGRLLRFRSGSFLMAVETQTVLVPVAVDGGAEILPKGRRRLVPRTMHVRCGSPIDLEGLEREDVDRIRERTRAVMAEMLAGVRAGPGVRGGGAGRGDR